MLLPISAEILVVFTLRLTLRSSQEQSTRPILFGLKMRPIIGDISLIMETPLAHVFKCYPQRDPQQKQLQFLAYKDAMLADRDLLIPGRQETAYLQGGITL